LDGATSLVGPGNFEDMEEFRSLMKVVEDKKDLTEFLEAEVGDFEIQQGPSGVKVKIGEENRLPELKHLSIVTSTYRLHGRPAGVLGVLGTKNMQYSRMISLVDFIGSLVSRSLEKWEDEEGPDGREGKR